MIEFVVDKIILIHSFFIVPGEYGEMGTCLICERAEDSFCI